MPAPDVGSGEPSPHPGGCSGFALQGRGRSGSGLRCAARRVGMGELRGQGGPGRRGRVGQRASAMREGCMG